ncbi:hypothetical protein Mgra_00005872 [Meloidogyne graminicola]|uniref:Skp1-related protein n=1 Tax=Meloidogyne graminicola TaxID=189291 RepID=A0A8S9ZMS6_9BILA|nr:hypothetical protein Mgra_00005872 [Meloidogyne graminicola]
MSLENNVEEELDEELPMEEKLTEEKLDESKEDKEVVNDANSNLTEEQKQRKIKCVSADDKIIEVEWYLLMDCGTFANLWESLNLEESCTPEALECFHFPLNEIDEECFVKVVEWLRNHHGLPPVVLQYDRVTSEFSQRRWFELTDWETTFFDIEDFEFLKEIYLASNFLDIKSLYYYCAQECARRIMDKSPEEIREMLCLPDDLTDEDKAAIAKEYEYRETPSPPPAPTLVVDDESELQGTSSQFMQQSSSKVIYDDLKNGNASNNVGGSSSNNNETEKSGEAEGSSSIKTEVKEEGSSKDN